MKKVLLLSCAATVCLFAGSDYVPFSKFSKEQKVEYKFETLKKKVVVPKKTPIVKKEIVYKKPVENIVVKKEEILQETTSIKKATMVNNKHLIHKKEAEPLVFNFRLNPTISSLTSEYSSSSSKASKRKTVFEPTFEVSTSNHTIGANYLKVDNDFSSTKLETTWYKLFYKYKYHNTNLALIANHLTLDKTTSEISEIFPSFGIDFANNVDILDLSYGASVGKGSDIDYSYEYFFNIGVKPYNFDKASFVLGYKNRTVKVDNQADEKIEFRGPFIGINSTF